MFRFGAEHWLYGLVLVPLLGLFLLYAFRAKRKAMAIFGNPKLMAILADSVSRKRRVWKAILILLATTFLILALARPQWGAKMKTVKREGQDILIALDVSTSMLAEDIKPNRLEKAKHAIASLIDQFRGDRVGLIAFSGKAFVQCPLTLDYGAVKMFLNAMDPEVIPVPGTAIEEAILKAVESFPKTERKHKVLILITDGEDHGGDPLRAAKAASNEGVVIYTVGIGTPEGVPIPIKDERGNPIGFKKTREGEVVMTKLDEITLEKIALETGGKYYRASPSEMELKKIYDDILKMEKKTLESKEFEQYEERFQSLLGIALFCLALELLISDRRKVKREWKGRFTV